MFHIRTFAVSAVLMAALPACQPAPALAQSLPVAVTQDTPYPALVVRRIAQQKRYPREALRLNQEGVATVSFKIGPDGRVFDMNLVRSTGFGALDSEAQAMVWRAHPFPRPPDGVTRAYNAPINFKITADDLRRRATNPLDADLLDAAQD